jgi:uncharacterized membrane protein
MVVFYSLKMSKGPSGINELSSAIQPFHNFKPILRKLLEIFKSCRLGLYQKKETKMIDTQHIHPMIVHFPIALLIVGLLADAAGLISKKDFFSKAGFYLLILGTLGVVAAYFSGNLAGDGVTEAGSLKQALESHEEAAELSIWLMSAAALVRIAFVAVKKYSGSLKWIAFALFLIGVLSIARTGYYGGELVYKHAAGVQLDLGFGAPDAQNFNINTEDED